MPKGIPVTFVAKPENAALAAVRIFALSNPELKEQLDKFKQKMEKAVYDGAKEVKKVTDKKDVNRLAV
jgi:phosphoribosylcarboxyaminoimidazole (NCAIR) mutase